MSDEELEKLAKQKALEELPMDQASRMARAKEMGFDVHNPIYHGTDATFKEFIPSDSGSYGPGIYTSSDPDKTSYHAFKNKESDFLTKKEKAKLTPQVLPLYTKKTFDYSNPNHRSLLPTALQKLPSDDYEGMLLANEVKKLGFDSLKVDDTVVAFDPKNIRSTFAKFDPSKIDSSDISSFVPKTTGEKAVGAAIKGLGYLDKGLTKLGHLGTAADFMQGNIPEAALDVTETALAKTGSAGAARVLPFLELLRPTEMEPKDDVTSDIPMKPERFKKLKQLYNKEE